jgi:hypothetical protein
MMSPTYTLVMDKERNDVLAIMFAAIREQDMERFIKTLKNAGVYEVFLDFLKDTADKEHALGWCSDPNCKANK